MKPPIVEPAHLICERFYLDCMNVSRFVCDDLVIHEDRGAAHGLEFLSNFCPIAVFRLNRYVRPGSNLNQSRDRDYETVTRSRPNGQQVFDGSPYWLSFQKNLLFGPVYLGLKKSMKAGFSGAVKPAYLLCL